MPRFAAIEGARAWLAWAVVLSHISQSLGMARNGGHWLWAERVGDTAVLVFIAISGFVITGLVTEKREPYFAYITRRAFRIFPAYWLAYAFALAALPFAIAALDHIPWIHDPTYTWDELLHGWADSMRNNTFAQTALHLMLLQGVVPDSIMPFAGTAVLGPAWSLTLEWQFYLVAPLIVLALASKKWRLPAVIVILLGLIAFRDNVFGRYMMPNFLPGAAYIFMIGIAARLAFKQMQLALIPPEAALVALAIGVLFPDFLWFCAWASLYIVLLNGERWRATPTKIGAFFRAGFESKIAQHLGARSYAVYLVHLPTIQIATYLLVQRWHFTPLELFFTLIAVVSVSVLVLSDIMHRLIERPFIKLGGMLARRLGDDAPQAAAMPR